jgi:hypothetical protein
MSPGGCIISADFWSGKHAKATRLCQPMMSEMSEMSEMSNDGVMFTVIMELLIIDDTSEEERKL